MKSLQTAISDRGLDESKEIKRVMRSLKARQQSTKGRGFPKGLDHSPALYIAHFISMNHYKTGA